ncbi:MAG: hypothetical protein WC861_06035 [Candidatus Micrarchaeia archaeon]
MFIFQATAVSPRTAEQTLRDFKQNAEQARKKIGNGEQPATAFYEVDRAYGRAILSAVGMKPAKRDDFLSQVEREYGRLILYYNMKKSNATAPASGTNSYFVTINESRLKEIDKEVQKVMDRYSNFLLSQTTPTGLYGHDLQRPFGADDFIKDMDDMSKRFSSDAELAYIASKMGKVINKRYETTFYAGQDNANRTFKGAFEKPFEGTPSFIEIKGYMEGAFGRMTKVQKALDGLTSVIKTSLDKNYLLPTDDILKGQFEGIIGNNDIDKFVRDLKNPAKRESAIGQLFDKFRFSSDGTGRYAEFVAPVIEANYGEGAGVLDKLFPFLGRGDLANAATLDKTEEFFRILASDQGVAKKWVEMRKNLPETASLLMSQKQYLVPNDTTITRDRYDAVTALSFLQAYDKGKFMNNFTDAYAKQFLGIIGGEGDYVLPTPVPSTILQNYATLDTFYTRTEAAPQEFLRVVQELTVAVSNIYAQSFGATFKSDDIKSRTAAANWFLTTVTALSSDKMLGDLMRRYMDTPRPPIQLRPAEALVSVGPSIYDIDNIQSQLRSYVARLPSQFDDMNGYQRAVNDYLTQNPPAIYTAKNSQYLGQLGLGDFTDAYINNINKVFMDMMSKRTPFKPETGAVSGFGNYLLHAGGIMENLQTNAGLTGYNGYVTNTYNVDKNIRLDPQTWDQTYNRTTTNEILTAKNVTDPMKIPVELFDVYVNYMKTVDKDLLASEPVDKTNTNMDALLRAGMRRLGNLYVVFHADSQKENGVWKAKNVVADAYEFRDEGWYRVYIRDDKNGPDIERELNRRLTERYFEFSSSVSQSTLIRGGIEQQRSVDQTLSLTLAYPANATAAGIQQLLSSNGIALKNSADYGRIASIADNELQSVEGTDDKTYKILRNGNNLEIAVYEQTAARIAFFAGFETKVANKRLAVLGIKTPSDNKAAFSSLEVGKAKAKKDSKGKVVEGETPKIVTLGWMDMTHEERQFDGYNVQQAQFPLSIQNQSSINTRFIKPAHDIFLASYHVVDRFYGMMMGGGDVAGAVARGRNWGAGAIAQFDNGGIMRFMGNGMVSSEYFDFGGFANAGKGEHPSYGGVATIKNLGKDSNWKLTLSALVDNNIPKNRIRDQVGLELLLDNLNKLSEEIEKETSSDRWKAEGANADYRAGRTEDWTQRAIDILMRMRELVPADAIGDIRNDFSISLESGRTVHKISLSRIAGSDDSVEGNYVVTMHSINLGDKTSVSVVAGVKAYETWAGDQPPSPARAPPADNFGGFRFKYDSSTSFGYTFYNMFSSKPQAHVITVAHDFETDKKLQAMMNIKVMPKQGETFDFYIGNTMVRAKAEYDNLNTMKSANVAADYNVGKAIGATLPIFAGGGVRYTEAGELRILEPRLHVSTSPSDKVSFDLSIGVLHGWTPGIGGQYTTGTGGVTVRWRF